VFVSVSHNTRLAPPRCHKLLALGRETDCLGLKDRLPLERCRTVSRRHLELRFVRAEARVEVKAVGANPVSICFSGSSGEEQKRKLHKDDPPASVVSGDSIWFVVPSEEGENHGHQQKEHDGASPLSHRTVTAAAALFLVG